MAGIPLLSYLKPWLLPPGCNLLLVLMGLSLYAFKPTVGKLLLCAGFVTLWLFSAPIFAYNLLEILQNQYPALPLAISSPDGAATHRAIVVLGGGDSICVEKGNQLALSETTLSRVRYAAYLHKKTQLPIVVSGGSDRGIQETEAGLMIASLRDDFNVLSVLKEDRSDNTAEESQFLVSLLRQNHFDSIYLVTNAWHMPRSVYLFEQAGIRVIPAPMGYAVYDHHYTALSYIPNVQALAATAIALHELVSLLWQRGIEGNTVFKR